ncbi:glycoside hydrolase family 88 protein [Cohnella sp. GCM10027633]|uniref:glycoside hydrolase family 88 protein n=1 Tax=unclassified Cohnella TaxID=2636738 RepID=UPI00363ED7B7
MIDDGRLWVEEARERIIRKVSRTSDRIGDRFPHASIDGQYRLEPASWWTAGFWPGLLWLVYRETGEERLKLLAESCEIQLDRVILDYDRLDHDIGFMWTLTSVARYKLLGSESAKRRGMLAANLLMGRFNSRGGFIRAWNPWKPGDDNAGWAIIDCMMNLPLLHWATRISGDPRYKHAAVAHADTVLNHFVRPDGSVNHIVVFDPDTGDRTEALGGQGYAPDSAWSRGTAWALYGLALAYRNTGQERYLQAAKNVAHFFIANLPEDRVPHWDFRIPPDVPRHRDSSAGACAASGLLLLSRLVPDGEKPLYRDTAASMLHSLYANYGAWDRDDEEGLILHGTSHYPEGRNVDVPLIYGDYFFAEGIAQLAGREELFW